MRKRALATVLTSVILVLGIASAGLAAGPSTLQTSNMVYFGTDLPGAGAGNLIRTKESIWANLAMAGLDADASYTIWWVIWNDPSQCSDACGADDLGVTGNSVFYAGGFVTGPGGTANLSVHADTGPPPEGAQVLIPGGLLAGNGFGAVVHLAIRTHTVIIPGLVDVQTSTFGGGCEVVIFCSDQFALVFEPTTEPPGGDSGFGPTVVSGGRFEIRMNYETPDGATGPGLGAPFGDTSSFWYFFDEGNIEVFAKVLNGCGVNNKFWVFLGGSTNVGVEIAVTDRDTGQVNNYSNAIGEKFVTITDTAGGFNC